jgi:hypothetical protein
LTACLRVLSLVRPSICKALAFDALQEGFGAHLVIHAKARTVVKAKLEFGDIALQMLFVALVIGADHATLERAKKVLGSIGCLTVCANIVALAARTVLDSLVCSELFADGRIELAFIGMQF